MSHKSTPPNTWDKQLKKLFYKMIDSNKKELIQTIIRYSDAKKDHKLASLPEDIIKKTLQVAKYILRRFHKEKNIEEIVAYYRATGKVL